MGAEATNAGSGVAGDAPRYRAFISYSHKDDAFVARLHRALEGYRLPRHLRRNGHPARLTPIFRDIAELRADGDLSAQVKQALADSAALIVVASPNAKLSPWVAREIELFRDGFPDRPILVALIAGEPDEAFPLALMESAGGPVEPLAADFRKGGDGARLARLKLIATLADVPLDALVQRDAARRMRGVMAVTLGAGVLVLVLAALLVMAMRARAEAERQRAEAEGMVEFMLTDLRDKLRAVGRTDVMAAVNSRAMQHYAHQNLATLDDDSLDRRARLVTSMGEDREAVGDIRGAQTLYRETWRTTAMLLAKAPDDPDRIFSHARAENRLAVLAHNKGDLTAAVAGFRRADTLLQRLPVNGNADWLRLRSLVSGNLCGDVLRAKQTVGSPVPQCEQAVAWTRKLGQAEQGTHTAQYDLAFHLVWLAEAYDHEGRQKEADQARDDALAISDALVASDAQNSDLREQNMQVRTTLAQRKYRRGDKVAARQLMITARQEADRLLTIDPTNAVWKKTRSQLDILGKELDHGELR